MAKNPHWYWKKVKVNELVSRRFDHARGQIIGVATRYTGWKYIVRLLNTGEVLALARDEFTKLHTGRPKFAKMQKLCDHGNQKETCLMCRVTAWYGL